MWGSTLRCLGQPLDALDHSALSVEYFCRAVFSNAQDAALVLKCGAAF